MVGPNGPILPRPNGMSHLATPSSDLRDFGLLLHQMLTGLDPADYSPPASTDDDLEPSPKMVRSAALRLVERCCCAPGQSDLRHVSSELRLLQIMVQQLRLWRVGWAGPQKPARWNSRPSPRSPPSPQSPVPAGPGVRPVDRRIITPPISSRFWRNCWRWWT